MNKQAKNENIPIPFPSELITNLEEGTICYVIYGGKDDKGKSHKDLERGYLVQLAHKGKDTARVHVADVSYLSGFKKDKEYYDDVKLEERVYVLETPKKDEAEEQKANEQQEENEEQCADDENQGLTDAIKELHKEVSNLHEEQKKHIEKVEITNKQIKEQMEKEATERKHNSQEVKKIMETIRFDTQNTKGSLITLATDLAKRRVPPPPPPLAGKPTTSNTLLPTTTTTHAPTSSTATTGNKIRTNSYGSSIRREGRPERENNSHRHLQEHEPE